MRSRFIRTPPAFAGVGEFELTNPQLERAEGGQAALMRPTLRAGREQSAMCTVEVRLTPNHLATLMRDMRSWLDLHGISASEFSYTEGIGKLITRLIFGAEQEARAFRSVLRGP